MRVTVYHVKDFVHNQRDIKETIRYLCTAFLRFINLLCFNTKTLSVWFRLLSLVLDVYFESFGKTGAICVPHVYVKSL